MRRGADDDNHNWQIRTVHDLVQRERLAGPVGADDRRREDRRVRGEGPKVLEGLRVHDEFGGGGVRGGHELEGLGGDFCVCGVCGVCGVEGEKEEEV